MLEFQGVVDRMKGIAGIQSDAELARYLEVSPQALNNFKRRGDFPPSLLLKFHDKSNASLDWVAYGSKEEDYVPVTVYDKGNKSIIALKESWIRNALGIAPTDLIAIMVSGDDMEPTLHQGDIALVDTSRKNVGGSAVFALTYNEMAIIRRVQRKLDSTLVISCDNTKYQPEEIDPNKAPEVKVIGQVIWHCGIV